jgi:hypothetical protein
MTIILAVDFLLHNTYSKSLKKSEKISCKSHSSLLKLKKRAHESEWIQINYLQSDLTRTP